VGLFSRVARRILDRYFRVDPQHQRLAHRCRFERLEARRLLAADVHLGAVYFEGDLGNDVTPDAVEITFEGGAHGTRLDRIIISGDRFPAGLSSGDVLFDTADGGLGAFESSPLAITSSNGFTVTSAVVSDGGSDLVFSLEGFEAGEKLAFTIDVDEANFVGPDGDSSVNAIVEGAEFERSTITGTFDAAGFEELEMEATFWDDFDGNFAAAAQQAGSTLDLPADAFVGPEDQSNRTAGAVAHQPQQIIPATLSGYVYHDRNDDGQRDAGEEGLGEITIEVVPVHTVDGSTAVRTAVTQSSGDVGFWEITGLAAGEYRIVESQQPGGFLDGIDSPGTVGGVTVGHSVTPDADELAGVVIAGGETGIQYNFGEVQPGSIHGRVHADPEHDCVIGPHDELLAGVRIELYDQADQLVASTLTDANGEYRFDNLRPGTYRITQIQPGGYRDGDQHAGSAGGQSDGNNSIVGVALTAGTAAAEYNFCELIDATISGHVYHDASDDGIFDAGEAGIGGVAVELIDDSGSVVAATATSTDPAELGYYEFTQLPRGTYRVRETQPDGYLDGIDSPGTIDGATVGASASPDSDELVGLVLAGGEDAIDYDFGEVLPSSVSGRVHADPEHDCVIGPNDQMLAGVRMELYDAADQLVAFTVTDVDGEYRFDDLRPGTYRVTQVQPQDYRDGDQHAGSAGGQSDGVNSIVGIALTAGTTATQYDFCELIDASVSGHVYHDASDDGQFDSGEEGIGGVVVELIDQSGSVLETTTTSNAPGQLGYYQFTQLPRGTYRVRETQPAGFLDGVDSPGTIDGAPVGESTSPDSDELIGIVLAGGESAVNYNFGEVLPSSIAGRVHADPEHDCVIGPEDVLLEGVRIELYDQADQLVAFTLTDANGEYRFDELRPGTYRISQIQPQDYRDGDQHAGSAGGQSDGVNSIAGIELTAGTAAVDYHFCELIDVSVSGQVYHDVDNDGVMNAGEEGIDGVTVELLDAGGNVVASTVSGTGTAQPGLFSFTELPPGVYSLREIQPEGWLDGIDTAGNQGGSVTASPPGDLISQIPLQFGSDGVNYKFGELLPGSIAGSVFVDLDSNRMRDAGESGLEGVTVSLLDDAGQVISTTLTGPDGQYEFGGLRPGRYAVIEDQPEAYFHGGQKVGSGGGSVAGDDHLADIRLPSDAQFVNYDFAEVPPGTISGFVFQDGGIVQTQDGQPPENLSEIRDGQRTEDDTPLPGVVLELRNGVTGQPIDASAALPGTYESGAIHAVTDASGFYEFRGLRPGNYGVFQIQPAELFDGIDTPGTLGGLADNPQQGVSPFVLAQLQTSTNNDAILRIALPGGASSSDNNFSEVRVQAAPPPPPEPPEPDPPLFVPPEDPPVAPPPVFAEPVAPIFGQPPFIPPAPAASTPLFGSGGSPGFTWHLSVVDAGLPREMQAPEVLVQLTGTRFDVVRWRGAELQDATWQWHSPSGELQQHVFGSPDALPVAGDFNGDGRAELGVFLDGEWFIDLNGNGRWDEGDLWAKLGGASDLPVVGDWDGDGKTDIGIFGPSWTHDARAIAHEPGLPDIDNHHDPQESSASDVHDPLHKNVPPEPHEATDGARAMKLTSQGRLRAHLIDHVFQFGVSQDKPVVGDFNGDGIDTIGVFRNGHWLIDSDGDGRFSHLDQTFQYGLPGDLPVVGDFNGDGRDEVGVYRQGKWILDIDGNRKHDLRDRAFELGGADDLPVAGDWDGDGSEDAALYRR